MIIAKWMDEIRQKADPGELGMILVHNGIVRATSKKGERVGKMKLSYDSDKLEKLVGEYKQKTGIVEIKAWINSGELEIGDDIMCLLVAGRFRTDVLPVFEHVLTTIKKEIVREEEV